MKVPEFEREVVAGRVPQPIVFGGEQRWSRRQLDEALERLTGGPTPDWRQGSKLYAQ